MGGPQQKLINKYVGKNNVRYQDEFLDDMLEFENELNNMNKINEEYLNTQNLIEKEIKKYKEFSLDDTTLKTFKLNNKDLSQSIHIGRFCDILNKINLEIELNDDITFDEISNYDKQQLFETKITFTIGDDPILDTTILSNLFILFSKDLHIECNDNKMEIPLIDFNMSNLNKSKLRNINEEKYGLPQISLQYHCTDIGLKFTKDLFKYMKFNIKAYGYNLGCEERRFMAMNGLEYLFINSEFRSSNNFDEIQMYVNATKAIIIYFVPVNDDFIEYPQIDTIEVISNDGSFIIEYDDLLTMDLFDVSYTVIGLTDDFSSWKNINRTLKEPHKYLSSSTAQNIADITKDILTFKINYHFKPSNFVLKCNFISPNFLRFMSGMGGKAYSYH